MSLSRKHFLAASALGFSAAALSGSGAPAQAAPGGDPLHFHVMKPDEFDKAAMMQTLATSNPHKQVFHATPPLLIAGTVSLYIHMQNAMNAYEFSLGLGKLSTLGVLLGPSIVFALSDSVWTKYGFGTGLIGQILGLTATNTYYKAGSNLDPAVDPDDPKGLYQDFTAQAISKRNGKFFVCHNAMTAIAGLAASKNKANPNTVLADFEKNVLPGFLVVPAGVAALQQAQENGWKYFAVI